MRIEKNGKHITVTFDSFGDCLEVASKPDAFGLHKYGSRRSGSKAWDGGVDFDGAMSLATTGWPEGTRQMASLKAQVERAVRDTINARASSYIPDVTGEFFDIGRVVAGEPDCWIQRQDFGATMARPVIKIVASLAASGCVSAENMMARGIATAAAVDILEALGRRVEVWAASCGAGSTSVDVYTMLKAAGQPLDTDLLVFALAHPACERRIMFSACEHQGVAPGHTAPITPKARDGEIVTACVEAIKNPTTAQTLKMVEEICRECGVEIDMEKAGSIA